MLTLEDLPWSIFSTIRKLPNLEVLKLIRPADCKGVGKWEMEEEELKFLKLEDLNMVEWRGSGESNFGKLHEIAGAPFLFRGMSNSSID